mmetsp:Transcript_20647/g.65036  ORF Transcript_20647/g.65036 Transcript_20647/m.65036 type:complete len:211 (+) Transcript_20647:383-1015(+)
MPKQSLCPWRPREIWSSTFGTLLGRQTRLARATFCSRTCAVALPTWMRWRRCAPNAASPSWRTAPTPSAYGGMGGTRVITGLSAASRRNQACSVVLVTVASSPLTTSVSLHAWRPWLAAMIRTSSGSLQPQSRPSFARFRKAGIPTTHCRCQTSWRPSSARRFCPLSSVSLRQTGNTSSFPHASCAISGAVSAHPSASTCRRYTQSHAPA